MSIRKRIGDAVGNWIRNSPAVEKSIEELVDKTKEVISEDLNEPTSDETKFLIGLGVSVAGLVVLALACKHPKATMDIAEPVFRTVTINNYYGG